MKTSLLTLITVLLLGVTRAHAHGGVELGPNGGRLLEFSENETLHGEVTLTNSFFHVALLDKDMKPVELKEQSLTVTGGDRQKPEKPEVRKVGNHFVFPALKGDDYLLVLQFKDKPSARPVTARFEYDAATCSGCKQAEWLCKCADEKAEKDDKHDHDKKK
ncbi:MAG: hypothetical protein ACKVYV_02510 [Limisphaerales bacterium]